MSLPYAYIITIVIGGGIEFFAFRKKKTRLLMFSLALVTSASLFLGIELMFYGNTFLFVFGLSLIGFSVLNWEWISKRSAKAQNNSLTLRLFGTQDAFEIYFPMAKKQGRGDDTENHEIVTVAEDAREGMYYEIRFEIDLLPDFVKPDWAMELDISPDIKKKKAWQLKVLTDFGISEELVRSFVEQFNLWEKSDDVYYKRDFKGGKLIHIFEFPAIKRKLWQTAG